MKFHLVNPNDEHKVPLLASMHHFRWRVFVKALGWRHGLHSVNCMEYDRFDDDDARYLVHLDNSNSVTACMRFLPTMRSYMIEESFPDLLSGECPKSPQIEELTRVASLRSLGVQDAPGTGALAAAAIEYGLAKGLTHFIAITSASYRTRIEKAGWDPTPLGPELETPDGESSVVCLYSVNETILRQIRLRNGIDAPLFRPETNRPALAALHPLTVAA